MKKLLVILLLFFPVHGTWAKDKLTLRCKPAKSLEDKLDMTMYYKIDFDKKWVSKKYDEGGSKFWSQNILMGTVEINEFEYKWIESLGSLTESRDFQVIIDRETGEYTKEGIGEGFKNFKQHWNCKDILKIKKKF